jgi:ABC-type Fe3+-hydroxamate transport system substrate-binding protein
VSLVPSITETLFDLGAGEAVVGITDYCIFPEGLRLPRVGGTKNPRIDAIRDLRPDLVYLNLEENLKRHADAIAEFAPVHVSEPKTVAGVEELITTLGSIHQRPEAAATINASIAEELTRVPKRTFTFACPIWKNPWMWCGGDTYVSGLVSAAGGRNVLADLHRYPSMEPEDVLERNPEVIFLPDEPYAFEEGDRECFPGAQVIGPFPGHLFTWHGSRTRLGLRFLRHALPLHPP